MFQVLVTIFQAIMQFISITGDYFYEIAKNVTCDVIKIRLKRKDDRRSGKGNPP